MASDSRVTQSKLLSIFKISNDGATCRRKSETRKQEPCYNCDPGPGSSLGCKLRCIDNAPKVPSVDQSAI